MLQRVMLQRLVKLNNAWKEVLRRFCEERTHLGLKNSWLVFRLCGFAGLYTHVPLYTKAAYFFKPVGEYYMTSSHPKRLLQPKWQERKEAENLHFNLFSDVISQLHREAKSP